MVLSNAFLIRKTPHKEHDHVLELLTPDRGKIVVSARGTRRAISKLNPHLVHLNVLEVGVVDGPKNKVLVHADTHSRFVSSDYRAYQAAFEIIELVDERIWAELPEPFTFELVRDTFDRIAANPSLAQQLVLIFKTQFLKALGYFPNFSSCVSCSKYIAERRVFSFTHGGLVCASCSYINDTIEIKDHMFWDTLHHIGENGFAISHEYSSRIATLCSFMDKLINYFAHSRFSTYEA